MAVALTQAKINSDLTQNLESVYTNPDPRAYPMSSYSYMVVPTSTDERRSTPTRAGRSRRSSTTSCARASRRPSILGYSPLPKNLVLARFEQVKRIPGARVAVDISQCHNPALNILQSAPKPNKCMKLGSSCTVSTTSPNGESTSGPGGTTTTNDNGGPGSTTSGGGDPLGTSGSGSPGSGSGRPADRSPGRSDRGGR